MLALRSIFHKIIDDVFKTAKVLKLGVEDTEIKDWYMTIYLECPRNETKGSLYISYSASKSLMVVIYRVEDMDEENEKKEVVEIPFVKFDMDVISEILKKMFPRTGSLQKLNVV